LTAVRRFACLAIMRVQLSKRQLSMVCPNSPYAANVPYRRA
jgi:hypothetical protein